MLWIKEAFFSNWKMFVFNLILYWSKKYVANPQDFDRIIHCYQDDDNETFVLSQDYHAFGDCIPEGFRWNGSSSPNTPLIRWLVSKFYKSMKRSCVHDYLCGRATNQRERLIADIKFFLMSVYAEKLSPFRCLLGLLGVRVGAVLKIGSNF